MFCFVLGGSELVFLALVFGDRKETKAREL